MSEKILDLGCGNKKVRPDATGVDCHPSDAVDLIVDLNEFPYPFDSDSIDQVYMIHSLEHLNEPIKVVEEAYRILKTGGRLIIRVPHASYVGVWSVQHLRFFSVNFLDVFNGTHPEYTKSSFTVEKKELHWSCSTTKQTRRPITGILNRILSGLANLNLHLCERYWIYWVGGFEEIEIVLRKNKGEKK